MRRLCSEDGAGTVMALAVAAVCVLLVAAALPLYMGFAESRRAAGVADAAALAAADIAVGALPGVPCEAAASLASLADMRLTECELEGMVSTVTVETEAAGLALAARARAGPRSAHSERHGVGASPDD